MTEAQIVALADAVVAFLGVQEDDDVRTRAVSQIPIMVSLVKGYTRGEGFSMSGVPVEALQSVIVTATCRMVTNPAQSTSESSAMPLLRMGQGGVPIGQGKDGEGSIATESFAFSGGFTGFNDVEKAILHQHRVRNG